MRETGPAFKLFANAQLGLEGQNDTKPYIGVARVFLGVLKNQMKLGGVASGRLVRELEDGTRIIVQSIGGIDKFAIIAPGEELPERAEEAYSIPVAVHETPGLPQPPLEIDAFWAACCGVLYVDSTSRAAVWKTLQANPLVICEDRSQALAISDNGSTVVGYMNRNGSDVPFRWTQASGLSDMGLSGPGQALCVSASGNTVGGYCNSGGRRPFIWTAEEGVVHPPNPRGMPGAVVTCISPNGMWAAGSIDTPLFGPTPDTSINTNACVWRKDPDSGAWSATEIPLPGTSSRLASFQGPIEGPRPDQYGVVNIDDLGRVTLMDTCKTGHYVSGWVRHFTYHTAGPPFPLGDGVSFSDEGEWVMVSPNSYYENDPNGSYFHRMVDGRITRLAEGNAVSCADDVNVVVGIDAVDTLLSFWWTRVSVGAHGYNSAGDHSHDNPITDIGFSPFYDPDSGTTRPWWWSERRGKVFLQPEGGVIYDISEDGVVIVGYFGGGGTNERRPCYWVRGRIATAVEMSYAGGVGADVRSVARPRSPLVENAGAPPKVPR